MYHNLSFNIANKNKEDCSTKSPFSQYDGIISLILDVCNVKITDIEKIVTLDDVTKAGRDFFRRNLDMHITKNDETYSDSVTIEFVEGDAINFKSNLSNNESPSKSLIVYEENEDSENEMTTANDLRFMRERAMLHIDNKLMLNMRTVDEIQLFDELLKFDEEFKEKCVSCNVELRKIFNYCVTI